MQINQEIFRAYDIRGKVGIDLNEEVYYHLGRGYASFLQKRRISEVAVGRDNRLESEKFAQSFILGLNESGILSYDLGMSLSQIVYFSSYHFKTKGGAMITASHNPKEYNGLKLSVGYSDTMIESDIKELQDIIEREDYVNGIGANIQIDIFESYISDILKHFQFKTRKKLLIDGCNSTSAKFYPEIFRRAGFEVVEQNCELDGNFPNGTPDPTEIKVLQRVREGVKKYNCDIGLAFDTDGDRMAVVDESGRIIWMDSIVAIFAMDLLEYLPESKIVFNVLCSKQVNDVVLKYGGKPIMWKTGHSFIKEKLRQERAYFGGELSGHIFFTDNFYGHDDGAYASLRLLSFLERKNRKLSEIFDELPVYISSPEIKIGIDESLKFNFVQDECNKFLRSLFPGAQYTLIDGIRVDSNSCMVVIRASQNGGYITIKFESAQANEFDMVKRALQEFLKNSSKLDFTKGVNLEIFN